MELARGAPASLPGADIGTAFGDPPGGLAEPLEPDWRGTPVRGPHRPLGRADPVPGEGEWADAEWVGREYARGMHTDGRVRRRLVEMGKAWRKRPDRPLPEILPGKAEQRAAHRMLSNTGVRMEHIVEPHCGATCGRCRAGRFVLAIQDTTTPIVTVSRRPGGSTAWAAAARAARASPTMSGWRPPPLAAPWACSRWTRTSAGSVKGTAPAGWRVPAGQWSWTRPAPKPGSCPCATGRAISGFRVRNLNFLTRERPDDPARMYAGPDGIEVLLALAASLGPTPPRGPPDPDVRTLPVLTAGLAGFHPSKRQPMHGNRKLWQGIVALSGGVMGYQAMRDHGRRRMGE